MERLIARLEKLAKLENLKFRVPYKGHMITKNDSDVLRELDEKLKMAEKYERLKKESEANERCVKIFRRIIRENPFITVNLNDKDFNRVAAMIERVDRDDK